MTNFSKEFPQYYCPKCKVYEIFKRKNKNTFECMKCQKYTLILINE